MNKGGKGGQVGKRMPAGRNTVPPPPHQSSSGSSHDEGEEEGEEQAGESQVYTVYQGENTFPTLKVSWGKSL